MLDIRSAREEYQSARQLAEGGAGRNCCQEQAWAKQRSLGAEKGVQIENMTPALHEEPYSSRKVSYDIICCLRILKASRNSCQVSWDAVQLRPRCLYAQCFSMWMP